VYRYDMTTDTVEIVTLQDAQAAVGATSSR
jgi:hypothetical protein